MGRYRDAITELFTTRRHALNNPRTTVKEGSQRRRGRRIHTEELPGLQGAAQAAASRACAAMYGVSDDASLTRPEHGLRLGDVFNQRVPFGANGLVARVTVVIEDSVP